MLMQPLFFLVCASLAGKQLRGRDSLESGWIYSRTSSICRLFLNWKIIHTPLVNINIDTICDLFIAVCFHTEEWNKKFPPIGEGTSTNTRVKLVRLRNDEADGGGAGAGLPFMGERTRRSWYRHPSTTRYARARRGASLQCLSVSQSVQCRKTLRMDPIGCC